MNQTKKASASLYDANLKGSFLCFGLLSFIILILAFSFILVKAFMDSGAAHTAYCIIFAMIWASGLAILPSLPNPFPKKGIFLIVSLGIIIHLIFITPRIRCIDDCFSAFSIFASDALITLVLLKILEIKKISPRWIFLYTVNPCVLAGLCSSSPIVFLSLLIFVSAIYLYFLNKPGIMLSLLGISYGLFPYALPSCVLLINKENIKKAWIMVGLLAIFFQGQTFLPSVLNPGEPTIDSGALTHFLGDFFGTSLFSPLSVSVASLVIFLGLVIFHPALNPKYKKNPLQGLFFVFSAFVALMPGPPFPAFIWMAPLIIFRPSIMWLLLGFTAIPYAGATALAVAAKTPEIMGGGMLYPESLLIKFLVWFPLYASLPMAFYRLIQQHRKYKPRDWKNDIKSFSVIIPALNEAENIAGCIRSIRKDPLVSEIIVVDGGSIDDTIKIAELEGARIIIHNRPLAKGGGRGGQIKTGLIEARGEAVAIVHADTIITERIFSAISESLNSNPDVIGGAVGCRFDSNEFKFRAIEFANNVRMAYLGIAFGDQIQFFRRLPVMENNVFPDIPIMEDVELSLRLKNLGTQTFLFGDVIVSTRRWEKKGFRNAIWVIRKVTSYIWTRIWKKPDSAALYGEYYAANKS